jgi:hypothetical protein
MEHALFWPIFCGTYCMIGLILFEFSYYKVRVLRIPNEGRDQRYPAFRRLDVGKWHRWKFYPGALTLLPFRLIISVLIGLMCYLTV